MTAQRPSTKTAIQEMKGQNMQTELATENVIKGGESLISIGIRRSARGIVLTARVNPIIEAFFQAQSGEQIEVDELHREWFPVGKDAESLKIWHIVHDPGVVRSSGGVYSVNRPGHPLIMAGASPQEKVMNLSFLRLVGVSSENGIKIEIRGAFTLNFIRDLASQTASAVKQFYIDCLKPIDIQVTVSTQENR
jgi:hypothetical protein